MIKEKYKMKKEFPISQENQGIKLRIIQPTTTKYIKGPQLPVKEFNSPDNKNKFNVNRQGNEKVVVSNIYKRIEQGSDIKPTIKYSATNTKEINLDNSHKKWGIRPKKGDSSSDINSFKITVKKDGYEFPNNQTNLNYESKVGQYTNTQKYLSKPNIYISGSSQSNNISINNPKNSQGRSPNYNSNLTSQKSASNIFTNANQKILLNYRQNWNNQVRNDSITHKRSSANNTMSYSIIDTKKTIQQPYVLHVRKLDRIQSEIKHKKLDDPKALLASNSNHSIFIIKNVTKVRENKSNQNLSNIGSYSISDIKEKSQKEIIVVPRRNEIIVSKKPSRTNIVLNEPKIGLYKSSSQYNILKKEINLPNKYNNKNDYVNNKAYN